MGSREDKVKERAPQRPAAASGQSAAGAPVQRAFLEGRSRIWYLPRG